ncbi:MAG: helicase-related protein, partial [Candidatus Jordarchaeaceae archaeon]
MDEETINKIWEAYRKAAPHLCETLWLKSELNNLISNTKNFEALIHNLNQKMENEKSKIIVFAQFRETIALISREINKIPGVKSKVFIGQGNKTNLENQKDLDNISGLTQKQQKKIIEDFSQGKINVLCATSIGEEGLDIPEVNTVIFYEPIPSAIRTIQRAGRTARLTPGKLIILITKGTRD